AGRGLRLLRTNVVDTEPSSSGSPRGGPSCSARSVPSTPAPTWPTSAPGWAVLVSLRDGAWAGHGCGYGSDHDAIRALPRKSPARYCPSGQGMHVTGEVLGLARVPGVVSPGRRCSRIILHRTAGSEGADRGNPL